MIVSRADVGGLDDTSLRERCRSAPAHIRRAIDDQREQRGHSRLWTRDGLPNSSRAPAESRGEPVADRVLVVGVVAAGLSERRVAVATDGERLRERIEPTAYRAFLRAVAAGDHVVRFCDGHGGETLADTKSGTLRLSVDDTAGLVVQALVPVCGLHRQLIGDAYAGDCGLSVGLRPARIQLKTERGERVRVVQETGLEHVAVIRRYAGQGTPAYRGRLYAALVSGFEQGRQTRDKAVAAAVDIVREQRRRR